MGGGKLKSALLLFVFLFSSTLLADPVLEKRAATLYQEVRCPVCLGQSIADSEAEESLVLKKFIQERLKAGDSEDRIRETLRSQLGNDILFRPPFEAHTLFLWLAPFGVFLLVFTVLLLKSFRLRRNDS